MIIKSLIKLIIVLGFRTFTWGLITANFTNNNLMGGLLLSAIIPLNDYKNLKLKAIIPSILKILLIPMQMTKETVELIRMSKPRDKFVYQMKSVEAMQGSKIAKFLDVLLITITPMTLVTGEDNNRWRIHTLESGGQQHD
jgi:multisubunit Na+/H+ antiporter MnhE subunit